MEQQAWSYAICFLICIRFVTSTGQRTAHLDTSALPGLTRGVVTSSSAPRSNPTLVSLRGADGEHLCAGTLIGANVVLVAAHCLVRDPKPSVFIMNTPSRRVIQISYERFRTVRTIVHPYYSPERTGYDAALLVLNAPSDRPLTDLESSNACFHDNGTCKLAVSKWNASEVAYGSTSRKWLRARSIDSSECTGALEKQDMPMDTIICAKETGKNECQAISDGQLFYKKKQVGIPSWSNGVTTCQDSLGAYTSIPVLLPWINLELTSLEEGDDCSCSRFGFSGGVKTPWKGCKQNMPSNPQKYSCMVKGGSNCSIAKPSLKYPGAAWRLCGTLVSKPKPVEEIDENLSSCNFLWGIELAGESINNGTEHITKSELECCALCDSTEGCRAWTRINRLVQDEYVWGECWLKSEGSSQVQSYFANSGYKSGNTGAATSCSVMDRVDLAGGGTINDGRVVISQSESECCKYCDNTVGCEAWTRITQETEANRWGQCWLWNRTNLAGNTDFTNSGVMGASKVCSAAKALNCAKLHFRIY